MSRSDSPTRPRTLPRTSGSCGWERSPSAQHPVGATGDGVAARSRVADRVHRPSTAYRGDVHPDIVERADDDPAALLFTSGTTGRPKGAILTHGGIRAAARFGADALSFVRDDVVLGVAPFPHVLGQQVLFSSFGVGAAVCVLRRFEPAPALATMTETGTTVMMGVPAMCITLCQIAPDRRGAPAPPHRTHRRSRRPDRRRAPLRGDLRRSHPRGLRLD